MNYMTKKLQCYLDGDSLCIVKDDFINLQESPSMFIVFEKPVLEEFKRLAGDE